MKKRNYYEVTYSEYMPMLNFLSENLSFEKYNIAKELLDSLVDDVNTETRHNL